MAFDAPEKVKESAATHNGVALGESLRAARRARKFSQERLANEAGIDIATVQALERGRGTMGPLIAVLAALDHKFSEQPPDCDLGAWLAARRKAAGLTQQTLASRIGVSKPTIIQIEHGRGNIRGLLRFADAVEVAAVVAPKTDVLQGVRLFCGDCLDVMATLPAASINAIIADLPYSLTDLEWDRPIPLEPLWEQFRRLLTPTGVVVLTASQPFTADLVVSNRGWFKYSLVWEKSRATGFLQAKQRHLKKHEDILIFSPGTIVSGKRHQTARNMTYNPQGLVEVERSVRSRTRTTRPDEPFDGSSKNTLSPIYRPCYVKPNTKLNGDASTFNGRPIRGNGRDQSHSNYPTSILRFPSETKTIHPTQKPLDLMRYLVRTFTNQGDTVLDCCFGSGTTGVAAIMEGRRFVGIERDEGYFEMARDRLSAVLRCE